VARCINLFITAYPADYPKFGDKTGYTRVIACKGKVEVPWELPLKRIVQIPASGQDSVGSVRTILNKGAIICREKETSRTEDDRISLQIRHVPRVLRGRGGES
jgi:hypothetical protein